MSKSRIPSHLAAYAKPIYQELVVMVEENENATAANLRLCELAAISFHRSRIAAELIEKHGQTYQRSSGVWAKHPAVDNEQKYQALYAKHVRQLASTKEQAEEFVDAIAQRYGA